MGALQWKATQTGPHISSALNALQSQVTKATLKTLKEANDLIKVAKTTFFPLQFIIMTTSKGKNYVISTGVMLLKEIDLMEVPQEDKFMVSPITLRYS